VGESDGRRVAAAVIEVQNPSGECPTQADGVSRRL
jgi:hypothetical protein